MDRKETVLCHQADEHRVLHWLPSSPARAVLQIVPGMAEHIGRYAWLAEQFCGLGYIVLGHDHRGHGKSARPLGQLGDWDRAVQVVRAVAEQSTAEYPQLPRVILGHSMGSFMLQQLLLQSPGLARAWIMTGSNGKPPVIATIGRWIARLERWRVGEDNSSPVLQLLSFGRFNRGFEQRTEFDWLCRDEAHVDRYIADPKCGFALSTQSWVSLLDALGPINDPLRQADIPADTPICLVGGEKDPVSDNGAGLQRLADAYCAAGLNDVCLQGYPLCRHEILHEINRQEVFDNLQRWLHARIF